MTKQEWKEKLAALLDAEPEIGDKQKYYKELMEYLNMLEHKGNDYYGIRHELLIAMESYLEI
jgi:hypothetical protein